MIKETLLITNNKPLIEQFKDKAHIEHSICLGKALFSVCKNIIIDYDTFSMEGTTSDELAFVKDKIMFIGEGHLVGFSFISKEEFLMDILNNEKLPPDNTDIVYVNENDMPTSLEIDRIVNLYVDMDLDIAEVVKSLAQTPQTLKNAIYKTIALYDKGKRLKKLGISNKIVQEYMLYRIKEKLNIANKKTS